MKTKKIAHLVWKGWKKYGKKEGLPVIVGKWQYISSSGKGEISLVKFLDYFMDGRDFWEIYCLKGDLFEDVERFGTKKEAEKRIRELLE